MGKMVGMAEFKAHCVRLLREVEASGEPLTVTVRGRPVAMVSPPAKPRHPERQSAFGMLKGTVTIHGDIIGPIDSDWESKWEAEWGELGFTAGKTDENE